MRGRLNIERSRGGWMQELRFARSLDITNDFRVPFDSGTNLLAGMSGVDPNDYVDRASASIALGRAVGRRNMIARAEFGVASDAYRPASVKRGYFGRREFAENRYVDEGRYVRTAAWLEWRPDVSAEFVKPGIGARFSYERGDGELDFQRAELRVIARGQVGPLIAMSRFDVGGVFGDRIPPQQLFELGAQQNLPGYDTKEFAGSHAAVLRGQLMYLSPYLRQPMRLTRRYTFPGLNPGLSVGVQSGWADAPTVAAKQAIDRLRRPTDDLALYEPLSRPTDGIRATVSMGLRFFSGAVFVGVARPVDHAAPWRFTMAGGL